MKRKNLTQVLCFALSVVTFLSWGQEMSPAAQKRLMEMAGGRIMVPRSQKGVIAFVNCQKKASRRWIEESIEYLEKVSRFNIVMTDGSFTFPNPKSNGDVTLFVVEDANLPILLCAPEACWAAVNVTCLASDKEPFFKARVKKELSRGFAMLCGAMSSQYQGSLMGGVGSIDDLDKFVDYQLPIDVLSRLPSYMKTLGVTPARYATYRAACKQGWAPAPTNEFQKAIWEKIKADKERGPTNPITIPPPNQKK